MKKTRREVVLGVALLAVWVLLKILPRSGFLMWVILLAGIALVAVGLMPEKQHQQVKTAVKRILGRK